MPSHRSVWLAAVGLAIAWHVGWALVLRPAPLPTTVTPQAAPAITWRLTAPAASGAADDVNMALVRSPALFSLPSPFGFSRPILEEAADVGPPLEQAEVSGVLLARSEAREAARADVPSRIRIPAAARLDRPIGRRGLGVSSVSPPVAEGRPGVRVSFDQGFTEGDFIEADLSSLVPAEEVPWTLVLHLETGSRGEMIRVLADPRAEEIRDKEDLIRRVYGWRLKKAESRSGQVTIRHQPAQGVRRPAKNGEKG